MKLSSKALAAFCFGAFILWAALLGANILVDRLGNYVIMFSFLVVAGLAAFYKGQ